MDINKIQEEINKSIEIDKIKFNLNISNLDDFDLINKELFLKSPLFYDENRIWWAWNDKKQKWEMIDDTDIYIKFNNVFNLVTEKTPFNSSTKTTVINALKEAGRRYKYKYLKDIDDNWVAFKDCFYDVKNNEIIEKDKTYFVNNVIPYNYKNIESTETPILDNLFSEWTNNIRDNKKWNNTLWEVLAYSMLPSYPIDTCFALVGSGSNGKSSFLNLLLKFIGFENCTTSDFDLLTTNRFEAGRLFKKLVCLMGEIDDTVFSKTALFKRLLGKDMLRGEFKRINAFDFTSYAKLIIATNTLPMTTDQTRGFYRRWIVIDFPNEYPTNKGDILNTIPEEEFLRLPLKLIKILSKLLKTQEFTNQGSIDDRRKRYEEKANPVNTFFKEFCLKDINGFIPVFEFYDRITPYLNSKGYKNLSKRQISSIMRELGFESITKRLIVNEESKTWKCYEGVSWITKTEYDFNVEKEKFELVKIKDYDEKEKFSYDELVAKLDLNLDETKTKEFIKKLKTQGVIAEIRSNQFIIVGGVI
jgi:P4 family phage/plasmid primase-like protien